MSSLKIWRNELITGKIEEIDNRIHEKIKIKKKWHIIDQQFFIELLHGHCFCCSVYHIYFLGQISKSLFWFQILPSFLSLVYFSKKRRIIFDVIVYDIYPEILRKSGYVKSHSWIFLKWNIINREIYSCANKIFYNKQ